MAFFDTIVAPIFIPAIVALDLFLVKNEQFMLKIEKFSKIFENFSLFFVKIDKNHENSPILGATMAGIHYG